MRIISLLFLILVNFKAVSATPLPFQTDCSQPHLKISAVGDVLLHQPLQRKALKNGFSSLWQQAIPLIRSADIAFANIEGPVADGVNRHGNVITNATPDNQAIYSSYPLFNYPPSLAKEMFESGFDIVSTANNHSLDRFGIGIDKTIDTLDSVGLTHIGTRKANSDSAFYKVMTRKGFKLAWIACTQDTNGIVDKHSQVLYCYKRHDRKLILRTIQQLKNSVDAIIVSPHWGTQYSHTPNHGQIKFAKQLLNAGATAIIGSHPHVVQPIVRYKTTDGRDTLIAYSLGNFVSFQGTPKNRSTIILNLALTKAPQGNATICSVNYQAAYMENRRGLSLIHLNLLSEKQHDHIGYKILRKILSRDHFI